VAQPVWKEESVQSNEYVKLLQELGPLIGLAAVLLGTLLGGWLQARISKDQVRRAHENQLQILQETHLHNLNVMTMQQKREEDLRLRQFTESDRADRLVVMEYVDLLLPRLIEVAAIYYLSSDNKDKDEGHRYQLLQRLMTTTAVDPAHPERNLGLRMAFLLFQLIAALRIALNARWTRPLSEDQAAFLAHWESHIEPMICSGRYPGKELLYREQIEIVTEEMLVAQHAMGIFRPLNWKEFCDKCASNPVMNELSELVASRLRFIFNEGNALPPRKAMQCRLGIMALYLIELSKESGNDSWTRREDGLWQIVGDWFRWEMEQDQEPRWYVLRFGDVEERVRPKPAGAGRS